jgi:hypothetical protein
MGQRRKRAMGSIFLSLRQKAPPDEKPTVLFDFQTNLYKGY